jgi:dipeptidyl aminopeptidase/acylaminoacyl peptidase
VARIRALNFSPDGQWLSFTVMSTAPTFHAGIWVMSANGGTARLVTPKEMMAGRASWSSDGKSLMVSMGSGVLNQLWMVPIGGGERRRLATIDGGWIGSAELSPTGESVVAVRYPAGAPAMCVVVDVATGASREFKNFAEPPAYAWAPDGKTVYGIFRTDTVSELRALDVATGTVRAVARYSTIVRLEDDNNVTQRMVFDRGRQSFITMVVNDRSNVWVLKGLTLPTR